MKRPINGSMLLIGGIALGFVAGLGGAWLGASNAQETPSFPQAIGSLLDDSSTALTHDQHKRIAALRAGYETMRKESGVQLQAALIALSQAVVQPGNDEGRIESSALRVDRIVHERRMASVAYIADARALLDDRQRTAFDKAFLSVVATDPTYAQ